MLEIQYRMNVDIMQWASTQLYDNALVAHQSVAQHRLCDLPGVEDTEDTSCAISMVDTRDCDMLELDMETDASKGNIGEVRLVCVLVKRLLDAGLLPSHIAVISPYNLQVSLLRRCLTRVVGGSIEVRSVDGFQGQEREAVIISLVRSNKNREVGFLQEDRRLNVAVTRARRHVTVVGDSGTVSHHPFLASLVNYITDKGSLRSALEFEGEVGFPKEDRRLNVAVTRARRHVTVVGDSGTVSHHPFLASLVNYITDKGSLRSALEFEDESASVCADLDFTELLDAVPQQAPTTTKDRSSRPKDDTAPAQRSVGQRRERGGTRRDVPSKESTHNGAYGDKDEFEFMHWVEECLDSLGERTHLAFPTELNARQRRLIHEMCEKRQVYHRSEADGPERHIVVSTLPWCQAETVSSTTPSSLPGGALPSNSIESLVCPATSTVSRSNNDTSNSDSDNSDTNNNNNNNMNDVDNDSDRNKHTGDTHNNEPTDSIAESPAGELLPPPQEVDDATWLCPVCARDMPRSNALTHYARCERSQHPTSTTNKTTETTTTTTTTTTTKKKTKTKSKKKGNENKKKEDEEEDWDAVVADFRAETGRCGAAGCKESIRLLGQRCAHCAPLFCFAHAAPEAHGCRDAAVRSARTATTGATSGARRVGPEKRAGLERRLEVKLDEAKAKRQPKAKDEQRR